MNSIFRTALVNGCQRSHFRKVVYISFLVLLAACGGDKKGGDDGNTNRNTGEEIADGVFLDSPVINMGYRTATLSGVTDLSGRFHYREGEEVVFFIGDLVFPAVVGTGTVTPLTMFNVNGTNDPRVINFIRLLQSIDSDNNPSNGITIAELAIAAATQLDFSLSLAAFEQSADVLNFISNAGQQTAVTQLVSIADAIAHFEAELTAQHIGFTPYVDPSAEPSAFCQPPDGAREQDWFANIDSPVSFKALPDDVLNSSDIDDIQLVAAKSLFQGKLLTQGMGFSAAMGLNFIRCEISTPGNYCTIKPSTSTNNPLIFDVINNDVVSNRYHGDNKPYWNGTFTSFNDSALRLTWGRSDNGSEFVGWTTSGVESFYATENSDCSGSAVIVEKDGTRMEGAWAADGSVEVTFCGDEGCRTFAW